MPILSEHQPPTLRHPLTVTPLTRTSIPPPPLFPISISISISISLPLRAPSPLSTLSLSAAALPTLSCEPSSPPATAAPKRRGRGRAAFPQNPDSVLPFLSEIGLSEADVAALLSHDPRFLCASVEETLKPRMSWLQEMGFSHPQILHFLVFVPRPFRLVGFDRKIEYLMGVFGSIKDLLVFVKRTWSVLSCDTDKVLVPRISFLQQKCGLSPSQISMLLRLSPRLLTSNLDLLCVRAEELGFNRGSAKFWQALCVVCSLSQSTIDEKLRLLRELGFSEAELKAVVRKEPLVLKMSQRTILGKFETLRELGISEADIKALVMKHPAALIYSTKKMKSVVEFLATKMGCPKSYVAHSPQLLHYSIEGRLTPRHYVLETLKSNGVPEFEQKVSTVMTMSDKQFTAKFVLPFRKSIPGLYEAYISASKKGSTSHLEE